MTQRILIVISFVTTLSLTASAGGTVQGHSRDILSLAFSPDGKWLATASDDDTVKLWTWPDPKLAATLTGHRTASAVRFSPDSRQLVTGGGDEVVRLWDVASRKQLRTAPIYTRGALAWSPAGDLIAVGDGRDNRVVIYNARDLTPRFELLPSGNKLDGGYVSALVFSPDGTSIVAAGYRESVIHVFDLATRQEKWKSNSPSPPGKYLVRTAAFSKDGSLLVVGGNEGSDGNGEATLWRMPSGDLVGKFVVGERNAWITSVDISADGKLVAAGVADKSVRIWTADDRALVLTLNGADNEPRNVAFSIDARHVVAGNGSGLAMWAITEKLR